LREKGDKRRTIGLHYAAAQALQEYIHRAGLTSGPLFRPRRHLHTEELAVTAMDPRTMWMILKGFLGRVPNALRERELPDGTKAMECLYPHSLRATAATLLLDSGMDIMEVKELLGHRHVTTTQIYDKRRRAAAKGLRTRLHDLRHSSAVHRLTSWYREGKDVQQLLPQLSVYLGHTYLAATQTYLTMTPEFLHQASVRFEQYACEGGRV
jgi:site-specific recombinase XerD